MITLQETDILKDFRYENLQRGFIYDDLNPTVQSKIAEKLKFLHHPDEAESDIGEPKEKKQQEIKNSLSNDKHNIEPSQNSENKKLSTENLSTECEADLSTENKGALLTEEVKEKLKNGTALTLKYIGLSLVSLGILSAGSLLIKYLHKKLITKYTELNDLLFVYKENQIVLIGNLNGDLKKILTIQSTSKMIKKIISLAKELKKEEALIQFDSKENFYYQGAPKGSKNNEEFKVKKFKN